MRIIAFALCIFLFQGKIFGQNTVGQGKISGFIFDKSQQPVPFATVFIENKITLKVVSGTNTTEQGYFLIGNIENGFYKLTVRAVGFSDKILDSLTISPENSSLDFPKISITADTDILKGVEIIGKVDLIEEYPDKIVYNSEADITNAGGTAIDVLRKAPMVSVDLDNNVQMRGNGNVKILLNGKPSSLLSNNIGEALRQIPADMIKKVEVITNPSAKYDGEGTAGIINIITKKKTLEGINGGVSASAGTRNSSLFVNTNIRRKKIGSSIAFGGGAWYSPFENASLRNNISPVASILQQNSNGNNLGFWGNGNFGLDYEINKKNSLNTNVRFSQGGFGNNLALNTNFTDPAQNPIQQFTRKTDQNSRNGNTDISTDYTHTFNDSRKEFGILAQYSRGINNNRYNLSQNPFDNTTIDYQERNKNEAVNQEWSGQIDYSFPIDSTKTLEIGTRASLRDVNSDYRFELFDFAQNTYNEVANRSNIFDYQQNVFAGYTVFGYMSKKKFGVKGGVRYENTNLNANFASTNTPFSQNYSNVIPSISISKDFKKVGQFKIGYSRRIQRPYIFYLNPYINYSDSKNISFGNPNLLPELTNNFEFGYGTFVKNTSVNLTFYFRNTTDVITSVRKVDANGVSSVTYENFATNNSYGVNLFGSTQFLKKGRINANTNIYYVNINDQNSGWMYSGNINLSFEFGKGWSFQSFGIINSPRIELQGTSGTWRYYTMGVRKELFKKKGGITLGMDNVFANAMVVRSQFETIAFNSENTTYQFNRAIKVSFNYSFGKVDTDRKPRKKKSIQNDDIKQGDSNGQQ